jgi:hypothetical protein
MMEVPLTQGKVALVDDADYEAVMAVGPWCAAKNRSGIWYAARGIRINGWHTTQSLHQFLTGFNLTDHEDGNGLNCQRYNLREATVAQNGQNQKLSRNNTSRLKGVSWDKSKNRWRARIMAGGKRKTIGLFDGPPPPAPAPEEAGRAYDAAALEYFGSFAKTNVMLGLLS